MHLPSQPHNLQVVTPVQLVFGVLSSLFSSIFLSTMVVNLGEKKLSNDPEALMATWSAFKKNITLCHPSHEAFSLILLLKRANWRITWNFKFLFTTGHVIEHTLYFIATPERLITRTYYWEMHVTNHRSDNLFWVLLISDNCDIFSEIADLNHPFSTHTRSLSSNNEILHINQ